MLSAGWRFTKHSANIYYADSDAAAAKAAGELGKAAQQKGRLVIAPSKGSSLESDEAQRDERAEQTADRPRDQRDDERALHLRQLEELKKNFGYYCKT